MNGWGSGLGLGDLGGVGYKYVIVSLYWVYMAQFKTNPQNCWPEKFEKLRQRFSDVEHGLIKTYPRNSWPEKVEKFRQWFSDAVILWCRTGLLSSEQDHWTTGTEYWTSGMDAWNTGLLEYKLSWQLLVLRYLHLPRHNTLFIRVASFTSIASQRCWNIFTSHSVGISWSNQTTAPTMSEYCFQGCRLMIGRWS